MFCGGGREEEGEGGRSQRDGGIMHNGGIWREWD